MTDTQKPQTPIIDTQHSPMARAQLAPVSSVHLTDAFWAPRRRVNACETLFDQHRKLEETGCIDNFRRAAGKPDISFRGPVFADSDLYKWLEAASWALPDNPQLSELIEPLIKDIGGAQQPDGYLHTYFIFEHAAERWKTINTGFNNQHELYSMGHFIQAAVAHHRTTGSNDLLDVATRCADHIADVFGSGENQRHGVDAHPEVEMALVELSRTTGNRRYLETASYFLDARIGMGRMNGEVYPYLPIREYNRIVGHAVCAVYLMAGVADVYAENGDETLHALQNRIWDNMTQQQMYVTGGIGPRWVNEAFGADYELPRRAYAETCASIGSIMWNARLLALEPDAKYADLMEQTLYNGFLSGLSLDGKSYFYQNPLTDNGTHRRQEWFGCACCPPNVARLLAQLPGYFYAVADNAIYINLYAQSEAEIALPDGRKVGLKQKTNYPWDGDIEIAVRASGQFALNLRIPAWAEDAELSVNDEAFAAAPGTYAQIERDWKNGDVVSLKLPMHARQMMANPRATELAGQSALMRGPLVYCFEQADNPEVDVRDIQLQPNANFQAEHDDRLGGVVVLQGQAVVNQDAAWNHQLYRPLGATETAASSSVSVTAIPYYTWANREPGDMTVWTPLA